MTRTVQRVYWLVLACGVLLGLPGIGTANAETLAACKRNGTKAAERALKAHNEACNRGLSKNTDWGTGSARKTAYQTCLRNAKEVLKTDIEVAGALCNTRLTPRTTSAVPKTTPAPRNEAFCQTLIEQFALMSKYDPSNVAGRKQYTEAQMQLDAKLVQLAPTSLHADVELQVKYADAVYIAMAAGDAAAIKAAATAMQSTTYLSAARRIADYCAIPVAVS